MVKVKIKLSRLEYKSEFGVLWYGKFNGFITNDSKGHIQGQMLILYRSNRHIPMSNCINLAKVNIKWSRLDYNSDFGAYLGFYNLISSMALSPMTIKVIFRVK